MYGDAPNADIKSFQPETILRNGVTTGTAERRDCGTALARERSFRRAPLALRSPQDDLRGSPQGDRHEPSAYRIWPTRTTRADVVSPGRGDIHDTAIVFPATATPGFVASSMSRDAVVCTSKMCPWLDESATPI